MSDWRNENLDRWASVASGWQQTRARFQHAMQPVSDWMVEAIRPQPGLELLELAAGLADTGLMAARRVAPGGKVIITDGTEEMVAAAREHAAEAGVENVELRAMQAEWIDLPAATVDGVLCRFGYMLLEDPEAALRETRRVLKPGGRVALAVWDRAERNPWATVFRSTAERLGLAQPRPPAPNNAGQFNLSSPEELTVVLEAAAFDDVEIEAMDLAFEAESLDDWWEFGINTSPGAEATLSGLSPADHYKLRDAVDAGYAEFVRDDGSVRLPARALVAAATA